MNCGRVSLFIVFVSIFIAGAATLFGVNDREKEFTMAVAVAGTAATIIAVTATIIFGCIGM